MRALDPPPDAVLLGIAPPEGLLAVQAIASALPSTKIIVLAVPEDQDEAVIRWAEAGVAGMLPAAASVDDVAEALAVAGDGGGASVCSPRVSGALLRGMARPRATYRLRATLTSREREIGELLEEGLSNKEIARRLRIELPTVKNHVHQILAKLDARRRGEAAAILRRASEQVPSDHRT